MATVDRSKLHSAPVDRLLLDLFLFGKVHIPMSFVTLRFISMQRQTDKAYLLNFGPGVDAWLPKKCIRDIDFIRCDVEIESWIADQKNLLSYALGNANTYSGFGYQPPPPPPPPRQDPPQAKPASEASSQRAPSLSLLIKLLGMTQSENDAEALVALRKATAEMRKFPGGTWSDLLSGKVTVIGDPFAGLQMPGTPKPKPQPQPQPRRPRRPRTPTTNPPGFNPNDWS